MNPADIGRMNQYQDVAPARLRGMFDLSLLGLKSLIILNSAALVPLFLLAHHGQLQTSSAALWTAFWLFVCGLVLAMCAVLVGYLSHSAALSAEALVAEKTYQEVVAGRFEAPAGSRVRGAKRYLWIAIAAAFASLMAFSAGAAVSLNILTQQNGGADDDDDPVVQPVAAHWPSASPPAQIRSLTRS